MGFTNGIIPQARTQITFPNMMSYYSVENIPGYVFGGALALLENE